ncbi:Phosphate regulon transcriptional regulatory protein PhoB [Roseivivax sp. THAF40]|uniref:response regulator n=1 Tax=Roseivivax sp. THAF40 TaxID=2587858 RepID=UPI0012688A7A|nr:response regulator [Roseivivax sp. THAF40]QFT47555.1 Phosphate regulon transcriptional regulatory protein PhoB [Roseivivax sp. THAF40]
MRILVVDDDPIFLDLVAVRLEQKGLTDLTLAVSSEDALKVIDAQITPFDCILLDILMPGIDGIELCALLRQRSEYRATPIIMITATQEAESMDRAFDAGATDFLRKPLDDIDLTGRIHMAMLLVDALRNMQKSRETLRAVLDNGSTLDLADVSKRICFPDADGMLDYFQFENKLLQLKDGNYQATLYRIDLSEICREKKLYQPQNTVVFLHKLSKALSNIKFEKPFWYSYIGAGRFICCVVGRLPINSTPLREQVDIGIHKAYEAADFLRLNAPSIAVTPLIEQRVTPRSTLIDLVRNEYKSASTAGLHGFPEISVVEDNIFAQISEFIDADS